jgi:Ca2+-binding RTX toxin-like protein
MNNKKLIGVGLLSVLGLIGVVLLVYAAVVNCGAGCSGTTVIPNGADTVNGSAVADTIYADNANGTAGCDSAGGNDLVRGNAGDDNIFGCLGNDAIYGGADDDDDRRPPQTAEATTGSSATLAMTRSRAAPATI